jgi:hypothetical protein
MCHTELVRAQLPGTKYTDTGPDLGWGGVGGHPVALFQVYFKSRGSPWSIEFLIDMLEIDDP